MARPAVGWMKHLSRRVHAGLNVVVHGRPDSLAHWLNINIVESRLSAHNSNPTYLSKSRRCPSSQDAYIWLTQRLLR